MRKRFEYSDAKSAKFWQVEVMGSEVTTRWGRLGASGQSKTKSFDSADDAHNEAKKQIKSKTKKGYIEVETTPSYKVTNRIVKTMEQ